MMNEFLMAPQVSVEAKQFIHALYGGMPPAPVEVEITLIQALTTATHQVQIWAVCVNDPIHLQWHLTLHLPLETRAEPSAVLLSPDGCWSHVVNSDAITAVTACGVGLASFDRLHMAYDPPDGQRRGPLPARWPNAPWGAISAWAWGVQANVLALTQMAEVMTSHIGVVGHSRGGKAVLLAGAIEPQIRLTVSHNSGCAGAASFQVSAEHAETLNDLHERFPHWLNSACNQEQVCKAVSDMDNVLLLSCLTGRHLCVLQAEDDLWAHPRGTLHAVERLRAHWMAMGLGANLTHFTRTGGHHMTPLDWTRAAQTLAQI
jgi:hypothetical protein